MASPSAGDPQRWEWLFADLEAQFEAQEALDISSEIAERTRRERALISFMSRLAGHLGADISLDLVSGERLTGSLEDLGADWVLLGAGSVTHLVPSVAVVGVLHPRPRAKEARMARRFEFGSALRVLSRDRATVIIADRSGRTSTGTIDVVGSDYLELTEHAAGEWRRAAQVQGRRLIPNTAIVQVRSIP